MEQMMTSDSKLVNERLKKLDLSNQTTENQEQSTSSMKIIDLEGTLLDQSFIAQLWLLPHACFVWIGSGKEAPRMGSLSTSIQTRYDAMPLVSGLIGTPEFEEQQIAQRLARRTGLQVFVTCQLPDHLPELFAFAEKKIMQKLIEEGKVIQTQTKN